MGEDAAVLSGIVSPEDATRLIRSEDILDSPVYSLAPEGYGGEWEESEYYDGWYGAEAYDAIGEGREQVAEVAEIVLHSSVLSQRLAASSVSEKTRSCST